MKGKFGKNTWKVVLGCILIRILTVVCILAVGFFVFSMIKTGKEKAKEKAADGNQEERTLAEETGTDGNPTEESQTEGSLSEGNPEEEKRLEDLRAKEAQVTTGSWQEAYAKVLREYIEQTPGITPQFSLECIDGDNIPEMILVDGGAHICSCTIYTFYQERAELLGSFGDYGTVSYVPFEGVICSEHFVNGGYYIRVYFTLIDGQAKQEITFLQDYNTPAYQIDEVDVSEEEYNSRWNEWSEADEKRVTRGYSNGCVEVNEANIEILLSSDFQSLFGSMQGGV